MNEDNDVVTRPYIRVMQPLLSVRDLSLTYPNGYSALKGVSFDVQEGEFLVVIGLSGSGKSTLMRTLNRLLEPTGGSIRYAGQDVTHIEGEPWLIERDLAASVDPARFTLARLRRGRLG